MCEDNNVRFNNIFQTCGEMLINSDLNYGYVFLLLSLDVKSKRYIYIYFIGMFLNRYAIVKLYE